MYYLVFIFLFFSTISLYSSVVRFKSKSLDEEASVCDDIAGSSDVLFMSKSADDDGAWRPNADSFVSVSFDMLGALPKEQYSAGVCIRITPVSKNKYKIN